MIQPIFDFYKYESRNIMHNTETITALCTSFGNAGIHVIRISGDKAFYVIGKKYLKIMGKDNEKG